MPNWMEVLTEIQQEHAKGNQHPIDTIRRNYINKLSAKTGRNTIVYYSGWLHGRSTQSTSVSDRDKNAFMLNIHKLDRQKGLDLVLHTPGGDLAATESIVDYLHSMFGNDIRAIIPQISMSAGTMIALSCKQIIMGKQSNLGPIDPQMGGIACQSVLDEFEFAKQDIQTNPAAAPLWQVIIAKYHPTFLNSCKNAIDWSEKLAEEWLTRNMFEQQADQAKKVLKEFSDHNTHKSHARHISKEKCKQIGVAVLDMENDDELQDLVLTIHHCYMHTFANSMAAKIVENNIGAAIIDIDTQAPNMRPSGG